MFGMIHVYLGIGMLWVKFGQFCLLMLGGWVKYWKVKLTTRSSW